MSKRLTRTLYIIYMMINIYSIQDYHNNNLTFNENQEDQDITDPNIHKDINKDLIDDKQEVKVIPYKLFNIKNLIASVIVLILILVVWLCFFPKKLIKDPNKPTQNLLLTPEQQLAKDQELISFI